jgi:hypothetical protein
MEMSTESSVAEIEEMFAQTIDMTRSLWTALPAGHRYPYRNPGYPPSFLHLRATTSDKIALSGTISVGKMNADELIYDLQEEVVVGEARYQSSVYPRTETYEEVNSKKVWVTSFD